MHDDRKLVEDRITRYLSHQVRPALYTARAALNVKAWQVPGEPVPVAEALRVPDSDHLPFTVGEHGWGTALITDSTYGYDASRQTRAEPAADTRAALAEAHALNLPLRPVPAGGDPRPLVVVDNPDVVVESAKLADNRSGDVVVRLYEARGGRAQTRVAAGFPLASAVETDLLERPAGPLRQRGAKLEPTLRPFQIRTLRLTRGTADA